MTADKPNVITTQDAAKDVANRALRLSYLAGKLAGVNLATAALDRFVLYDDTGTAREKAREMVERELRIVIEEIEELKNERKT